MRNRTYGGVRGRKTKVGRKLLRFPPTRLISDIAELHSTNRCPGLQADVTIQKNTAADVLRCFWWEQRESNPRPSACKADALNQLSYAPKQTCS